MGGGASKSRPHPSSEPTAEPHPRAVEAPCTIRPLTLTRNPAAPPISQLPMWRVHERSTRRARVQASTCSVEASVFFLLGAPGGARAHFARASREVRRSASRNTRPAAGGGALGRAAGRRVASAMTSGEDLPTHVLSDLLADAVSPVRGPCFVDGFPFVASYEHSGCSLSLSRRTSLSLSLRLSLTMQSSIHSIHRSHRSHRSILIPFRVVAANARWHSCWSLMERQARSDCLSGRSGRRWLEHIQRRLCDYPKQIQPVTYLWWWCSPAST